jgi:hypothetical protein
VEKRLRAKNLRGAEKSAKTLLLKKGRQTVFIDCVTNATGQRRRGWHGNLMRHPGTGGGVPEPFRLAFDAAIPRVVAMDGPLSARAQRVGLLVEPRTQGFVVANYDDFHAQELMELHSAFLDLFGTCIRVFHPKSQLVHQFSARSDIFLLRVVAHLFFKENESKKKKTNKYGHKNNQWENSPPPPSLNSMNKFCDGHTNGEMF